MLAILRIGHDTTFRGEGLSLHDALTRADYSQLRAEFEPVDLIPYLRADPALVKQWLMYCQDKRTHCGFGIDENTLRVESGEAGYSVSNFQSLEEAVACFIVRELDYWTEVGNRRTERQT